jgi:nicotinate-nucleotide adenylyltransferase
VDKTKKYGIFGGTFNPPHIGHLEIAKEAKARFGLDRVFFVPSFMPPHKDPKGVVDGVHRANMVKLLIEGAPDLVISEYEISKKTVSYSIDTIRFFETEFPDTKFYFIAGSDAFYSIDTWKESKKVLKIIDFIIYERKGTPKAEISKKFPDLKNIFWIENRYINLSSSDIRKQMQTGVNETEDLGSKVYKYIEENHLYK